MARNNQYEANRLSVIVTGHSFSRSTFVWLTERLRPRLQRARTNMREPIPVEQRVAIAVWWMANNTSYRRVGEKFGVARSTVAGIVVEVCRAIEEEILSVVVRPGPAGRVS